MFDRYYRKFNTSIWWYPVRYGLISFIFAVIVYYFDVDFIFDVKQFIPDVFLINASEARAIHSFIAGAFVTIMTFTFSTMMVVLTVYMSQLSPRVVENYLSNHSTLRAFAIFVGGVIFSLTSLILSSDLPANTQVSSGVFSAIYIVVGIVFFILFIRDVLRFIQMSNVIKRLYSEAVSNINRYVDMVKQYDIYDDLTFISAEKSRSVLVKKSSYLQYVDYKKLARIAEKIDGVVVFRKGVGEFAFKNEPLVDIYITKESQVPSDIGHRIRDCYDMGETRTENQDFNYSIQKIVEVTLRAISPGINDPNTAIHCIRMLSIVLVDFIELKSGFVFMDNDHNQTGLVFEIFNLERLMSNAFDQIVHYGASDPSVMHAVLQSLTATYKRATDENQHGILLYIDYIWEKIELNIQSPTELHRLKREIDIIKSIRPEEEQKKIEEIKQTEGEIVNND